MNLSLHAQKPLNGKLTIFLPPLKNHTREIYATPPLFHFTCVGAGWCAVPRRAARNMVENPTEAYT
jgi:hypothetical protein